MTLKQAPWIRIPTSHTRQVARYDLAIPLNDTLIVRTVSKMKTSTQATQRQKSNIKSELCVFLPFRVVHAFAYYKKIIKVKTEENIYKCAKKTKKIN